MSLHGEQGESVLTELLRHCHVVHLGDAVEAGQFLVADFHGGQPRKKILTPLSVFRASLAVLWNQLGAGLCECPLVLVG